MAHSSASSATVEGERLKLKTRQFFPLLPKRDAATGKNRFLFKLGIKSDAEISEAYPAPAEVCVFVNSMQCVGDRIHGDSISGWSLRPHPRANVAPGSAAHSATFLTVSGGCHARVVTPCREYLESVDFQKRDPPFKPLPRV